MKMCDYCGEAEATCTIMNPNDDFEEQQPTWEVCGVCKKVIPLQQRMSYGEMIKHIHENDKDRVLYDFGAKISAEAQSELDNLAEQTGTPTYCATITKKDDGTIDVKEILTVGRPE